ncbi:uncharacterized protein LOC105444320 [Strongylocentrotus purpuratus]|uniref:Ubiquitin-like domain-containing protein n=1 Tax=Strongylocentrotus purpuratus TaxID=7668 RepID=A0A7M7LWB7_STRPU|nr:uncharacterized protein LOC105444320 [Strongylocentrotus purpuratus]|eukprot:XP_011676726.1 PREDICTED: uncharacterized protein LOC105444320 isoform X1 [Strongylocentrotus purpuratus]
MSTYGNTGNEGQRGYGEGNSDVNTYGNRGNEPSRNRDFINIKIFVHPDNKSPVYMQANLKWTLDELHFSLAEKCSLTPGQCHSSCDGLLLSGSRKVWETEIKNDSTVILYEGEGTPTPGVIKNEPSKHTKVKITIILLNGKTRDMEVDLDQKQSCLVKQVSAEIGVHESQIDLMHDGEKLTGSTTLREAKKKIKNGSKMHVVLRVRGGDSQ